MSDDKPDRDESFLARWSRLKRTDDRPIADHARMAKGDDPETAESRDDGSAIDLTKLPNIEELTSTSDFSVFLRKGVPEELRRLALRKAWTLDPKIRDFVEVAENQYDFNKPDGVPGFGPLPVDTDLKALLAQAIGEVPSTPKAPAVADSAPADTSAPPESPIAATATTDTLEEPLRPAPLTLPTSVGTASATGTEPEPAKYARSIRSPHRHGGALPVSGKNPCDA